MIFTDEDKTKKTSEGLTPKWMQTSTNYDESINHKKDDNEHVDWVVNRSNYTKKWERFLDLLLGKNCQNLLIKN